MSENIELTNTIIAMDQLASSLTTAAATNETVIQQSLDSLSKPTQYYKRTTSHQTTLNNSSKPPTPLSSVSGFLSSDQLNSKIAGHDEQPPTSSFSTITSTAARQESINPQPTTQHVAKRTIDLLSSIPRSSRPHTAPVSGYYSSRKPIFDEHSMSRREIAETQLLALLTDRAESLPTFVHQANTMSLDEISQQLNIQPFILERLLKVINSFSNSSNVSSVSQNNGITLTRILNSTLDVRALVFFMMLDADDNKRVTRNEFNHFFELYFKSIAFDTYDLPAAVQTLLQIFHLQTKTQIDFEEFYKIIIDNSAIVASFSRFSVDPNWMSNSRPSPSRSKLYWPETFYNKHKSKLTAEYLKQNLSHIVLFTVYILVNLALLLYDIIYRSVVTKSNVCVVLARLGGILLDFNCSLVVVPMFKQTILFIRSHKLLRRLIPVDSHVDFHKFIGRFIALLAILHTVTHMINFGRLQEYSWVTYMFTTIPGIGWVGGFAPLSGIILCIILATIVIFSMKWVRNNNHFEVFYWTHLLYVVFFIFLIIHAKDFWKWAIGPLLWLFLEKLYSFLTRYSSRSGRTHLISATIEKSNVIKLNIYRPKNFTFKPGDYITINLPSVALHEFHPFTISSAPEQIDILQVHIEATGDWTKLVYQRFKTISENNGDPEVDVIVYRADLDPMRATAEERHEQSVIENEIDQRDIHNMTTMRRKKERVIVNGPYSSCARYVFDCERAVLIGSGIGITPYASVLSSLMAQFRASRTICQHCQGVNYHRTGLVENHRLKQVDFVWVTRNYKSFEWFLKLLHQFEQEQEDYLELNPNEQRFLNIHLYFTGMKDDASVGYYPFELVTQLWAQVVRQDIFTGLKSRTHLGRPEWNQLFTQLNLVENRSTGNSVDVFFCGNKGMAKAIQEFCIKYHFRFFKEIFSMPTKKPAPK